MGGEREEREKRGQIEETDLEYKIYVYTFKC